MSTPRVCLPEAKSIDFGNVRSASSSFLDELLAAELGERDFASRLRIVGMTDLTDRLANSVIRQRISVTHCD